MGPAVVLLLATVVPVLLALGAVLVVCMAAAGYFAWQRERCRRDSSCEDDGLLAVNGDGMDEGPPQAEQQQQEESPSHTRRVSGGSGPRRLSDRLSQPLHKVTADDIKGLSKKEFMDLFALLPPATPDMLQGEWQGDVLAMGWNFPLAYLLLHWRMGRGWYLGKGFDAETKTGFNIFYNHGYVSRMRRFDVLYEGPSAYDEQRSLHLVYGRFNSGLFGRMHEEVRCLHPGSLFLGLGSISPRYRTSFNSIPFLIVGPRQPLSPASWDQGSRDRDVGA